MKSSLRKTDQSTTNPADSHSVAPRVSEPHAKRNLLRWILAMLVGLLYFFSNPKPNYFYDYTWRIAEAILNGRLSLSETPPRWLNEFVPLNDQFYSVFPLGSVLTMMPPALGKFLGLITLFPAAYIVAFIGAATTWFCWELTVRYSDSLARRTTLSLLPTLGTWMWCNLCFGGAWQIALGFAVLGQFAALYFIFVKWRPVLAGFCFAVAFGNRTEVLLIAPIFLFLLLREREIVRAAKSTQDRVLDLEETVPQPRTKLAAQLCSPSQSRKNQSHRKRDQRAISKAKKSRDKSSDNPIAALDFSPNAVAPNAVAPNAAAPNAAAPNAAAPNAAAPNAAAPRAQTQHARSALQTLWHERQTVLLFCAVPFALGVVTLFYNYARFGSFTDFGYARIPGVLLEHNYRNGIFSFTAIPNNAYRMLFEGWRSLDSFPFYVPSGWGGSLFLSCPFLFLLFRRNRERALVVVSWIAIAVFTFVLWIHGDPGGWQYSYRYAMVMLPWLFLILLQHETPRRKWLEPGFLLLSVAVNAYATYLFYWTPYVKP